EFLTASQRDGAEGFRLVTLAVTQEAPDLLFARLDEAAAFQVLHEARLVDRLDRTQTHGYGRELPEIGHQPGGRIGGQAVAVHFPSVVGHLLSAAATVGERAGVEAR